MKRQLLSFTINLALLLTCAIMAFSGLWIQINFHMGNHGEMDENNTFLGEGYLGWSEVHKISIIFISIFFLFHFVLHWKWYNTIIRKNLISKNKQTIALSIVFILSAITGYIPWLIKLTGGEEMTRKMFIEIHDKLTLILLVFLILHVAKKLKWFNITFGKLKNAHSTHAVNKP
jgi:hypothetical protein